MRKCASATNFDIVEFVQSKRVAAALRGKFPVEQLTESEEELYDDLIALMPPSKESEAFFAQMRRTGGAVGIDDLGRTVRLLPGGEPVAIDQL